MSALFSDLHPDLQPLCAEFLDGCKNVGLDVRLLFTYRTPAEQDALYAQGRTKPGKRVTNLTGKQSKHCYTIDMVPASKAFDIGVFDKGKYIQDGDDKRYVQASRIGKALGLACGIDWKQPHDSGHYQID